MKTLCRCLGTTLFFFLVVALTPSAAQAQYCWDDCNENTPCSQGCNNGGGDYTTCGNYGVCYNPPPPPSCHYVPVSNWQFCHIDQDSHFFWYSIEAEYEAIHVDANGTPGCPPKYIQVVFAEVGCWPGSDPVDCCADGFGLPWNFCFAMIYGDICHR